MLGALLGIVVIFIVLMAIVMSIFDVSATGAFIISLVIFIIMIIINVSKDKIKNDNYEYENKDSDDSDKNKVADVYDKSKVYNEVIEVIDEFTTKKNEEELERIKNNTSESADEKKERLELEFLDFIYNTTFTNNEINSNFIKPLLKEKGYKMNTLLEDVALDNAIRRYKKANKVINSSSVNKTDNLDDFFKGQTLNLYVTEIENSTFNDNTSGDIVYFNIKNIGSKRATYEFNDFLLITANGNEKEFDSWLRGFNINNPTILSNNFRSGAVIFKHNNTLEFYNNSKFVVSVSDLTNGKKYNLIYILRNNKWEFLSGDIEETEKQISKTKLEKELKNNIERIEAFEEKIGIILENISINISKEIDNIDITGEIIKTKSEEEKVSFALNIVLYDENNSIIDNRKENFYNFDGYDVFKFSIYDEKVKDIKKIRIFVKE